MKDRIMSRQINSVVGHFLAECNLDKKTTIIRDPRNKYQPVAFVPSVEKAEILQAIRRVGQLAKMEQSFELLGIQVIKNETEIDQTKAEKFLTRRKPTAGTTRVASPLRPGGSLPIDKEEAEAPAEPKVEKKAAAAPASTKKAEKKEAEKKDKRKKASSKHLGKEHGW